MVLTLVFCVLAWNSCHFHPQPTIYCLDLVLWPCLTAGCWEMPVKEEELASNFFFLEKALATHSSPLAWKIPWMEESSRLQSMGSLRVGHDWVTSLSLFPFMHWRRKWQRTPVFLSEESQGWGAWWAAVYGVAQSLTRLKRLSSSSSSHILVPNVRIVLPEYARFKTGLPWQTESHASSQSMCVCVLSCFSRVWLCDPLDSSPSGSSVHGSF